MPASPIASKHGENEEILEVTAFLDSSTFKWGSSGLKWGSQVARDWLESP